MHILQTLTLLALGSTGLAYVIDMYEDLNCEGSTKEINVWDNTCAYDDFTTWDDYNKHHAGFSSFRVKYYGAGRQRAVFMYGTSCLVGGAVDSFWADGGSDKFLKGECVNLWRKANVMRSQSS